MMGYRLQRDKITGRVGRSAPHSRFKLIPGMIRVWQQILSQSWGWVCPPVERLMGF